MVSTDASLKTDPITSLMTTQPAEVAVSQTLTHQSSLLDLDSTANTISPSATSNIIFSGTFIRATITTVVNGMPSSNPRLPREGAYYNLGYWMTTRTPAGPEATSSTLAKTFYPLRTDNLSVHPHHSHTMKSSVRALRLTFRLFIPLAWVLIISTVALFFGVTASEDPRVHLQTTSLTASYSTNRADFVYPQTSTSIPSTPSQTHEPGLPTSLHPQREQETTTAASVPLPTDSRPVRRPISSIKSNSTIMNNAARGLRVPFPFALLPHLRTAYAGLFDGGKRQNEDVELDLEEKKGLKVPKVNPKPKPKSNMLPNGTVASGATSAKIGLGWRPFGIFAHLRSAHAGLFGGSKRHAAEGSLVTGGPAAGSPSGGHVGDLSDVGFKIVMCIIGFIVLVVGILVVWACWGKWLMSRGH